MISVIIPTLNEETTLRPVLDQFRRVPGDWEVIVADSGSDDVTVAIARELGATVIEHAPAGRGAAMNAGAERATGDILLFLHADTFLPDTAYRLIVDALADAGVSGCAFRLRMDKPAWRYRMISPIATLRFRLQRTFFGDQAIAVRRTDFDRIGGYREPLLMEDVDLSQRLRRHGKLRLLPAYVTTSARRFEHGGVLPTLVCMTLFQLAYAAGVPAARIARWYRDARTGPDAVQRFALDQLELVDVDGRAVDLAEDGQHGPVLLVFLRWLG